MAERLDNYDPYVRLSVCCVYIYDLFLFFFFPNMDSKSINSSFPFCLII